MILYVITGSFRLKGTLRNTSYRITVELLVKTIKESTLGLRRAEHPGSSPTFDPFLLSIIIFWSVLVHFLI